MKLNKIASAVSISLAALALTACGGSSKSNTTPVVNSTPPTTTNPSVSDAEKKKISELIDYAVSKGLTSANAAKFAQENKGLELGSDAMKVALEKALKEQDAAAAGSNANNSPISNVIVATNPTINGFDSAKVPSVSTKHYVRHTDSTFDRFSNKSNMASSGDSTFKKLSNPYLTNFVIGSEGDSTGLYATDSLGEEVVAGTVKTSEGGIKGVVVLAKDTDYFTDKYTIKTGTGAQIDKKYKRDDSDLSGTGRDGTNPSPNDETIRTMQYENNYVNNVAVVADANNDFLTVYRASYHASGGDESGQSGLLVYTKGGLNYGAEENVYKINTSGQSVVLDHLAKNKTKTGVDTSTALSTRFFGKNYRDYEAGNIGGQITNNTYVAKVGSNGKLDGTIIATKLNNVQYGRLTANIDALSKDPTPGSKTDKSLIYRQFAEHGERGTVDTYFYRGTNSTTIDQMNEVKAKGGVLNYYGHALTYGIGPVVGAEDDGLSTSYSKKHNTIGNFVHASFDTATNKVQGSIYNLINEGDFNKNVDFEKQDLVTFTGVVSGNTVADGVATKLGATAEKGTFIGSFYGAKAEEFGGNVSSVTKESGFSEAKWGAVFGATIGDDPRNYSTGQTGSTKP